VDEGLAEPLIHRRTAGAAVIVRRCPGIAAPVTSAVFGDWRGCCSCSCSRGGAPWGGAGRCAARRARHAQRSAGGGPKTAAPAAPFSVLAVYCCRLLLINTCALRLRVWTRSYAAGGHSNIAQIMRGGSPDNVAAATLRIILPRYVW